MYKNMKGLGYFVILIFCSLPVFSQKNLSLSGTITAFREYKARQTITTNQFINNGIVHYKSGSISFTDNFEVTVGGTFNANSESCN